MILNQNLQNTSFKMGVAAFVLNPTHYIIGVENLGKAMYIHRFSIEVKQSWLTKAFTESIGATMCFQMSIFDASFTEHCWILLSIAGHC